MATFTVGRCGATVGVPGPAVGVAENGTHDDIDEHADAAGDEHDGRVQFELSRNAPLYRHVHQDPGHNPEKIERKMSCN